MGNLIKINQTEINSAKEFADLVDKGEISHGIICYRKTNGDICYRVFNPEHKTYLIGLMTRTILTLHGE
jgi:trehalose utilization protein